MKPQLLERQQYIWWCYDRNDRNDKKDTMKIMKKMKKWCDGNHFPPRCTAATDTLDAANGAVFLTFHLGNNFKKCPELTAQNAQNQFQQSFNIVDMSNIHGKHVHSGKTWWNLIRGIVFFVTNCVSSGRFWNYCPPVIHSNANWWTSPS